MHICWKIFEENLAVVSQDHNAKINLFVLMSNHFHLLLSTPDQNLDCIMQYLIRETSRQMARTLGRINRIFGGRYKRSLITQPDYYCHSYKYGYINPVRAGICKRVEDYPYSTIRVKLGKLKVKFPLYDAPNEWSECIPQDEEALLDWLNIPTQKEQDKVVSLALRRTEFKFSKDKKVQKWVKTLQVPGKGKK